VKRERKADSADQAKIWILFGQRTGDNLQLLALARRLVRPYRIVQLDFTWASLLPPRLVGARDWAVKRSARPRLDGDEPDLVLGITSRSVSPALSIKRRFGGRPRLVHLGHPRSDPALFDLVITTPQYGVPDAPNVLRLPLPVTGEEAVKPDAREKAWLKRLPRPHRLLVIGGHTMWWRLKARRVVQAFAQLARRSRGDGGSVIVTGSPRTPRGVLASLAASAGRIANVAVALGTPRYRVLLDDADEIYVTADSASMIAEAVASGKPVGIVPIEPSIAGRGIYALTRALGWRVPMRDLSRLWDEVEAGGLAGTLAEPASGKTDVAPLDRAAAAVERLMGWDR
jgi:mitochondrial fission protein ELM1